MRLLAEVVVIALLIGAGWNRSFRDWAIETRLVGASEVAPAKAPRRGQQTSAQPQPSASVSGAWMWDKERRTALDRPAYNPRDPDPRYVDPEGRSFRIDQDGKRQYD